jgi:hypothetical protein
MLIKIETHPAAASIIRIRGRDPMKKSKESQIHKLRKTLKRI